MKTSTIFRAAIALAPMLGALAFSAEPVAKPAVPPAKTAPFPPVQLTVGVPATMRPWVSDEVAESFADRVIDVLHRQGLKSEIRYVGPFDNPSADRPLLEINLIEWRTDHLGNVDCVFSAALSTPQGRKSLGLFNGMSVLMFSPRDWYARAEQFDAAARQAIEDLFRRIVETRLLSS